MQLALDIGNTRIKAGVFEGLKCRKSIDNLPESREELANLLQQYPIESAISCSTRSGTSLLENSLASIVPNYKSLTYHLPLPFQNNYATPETLGMDRIAAVAGAHQLYPNDSFMVVDAGTCITLEYFKKNEGYMGGRILPGIDMRFKAMHHYTAKLPLIAGYEKTYRPMPFGNDTRSSMMSGVLEGVTQEVKAAYQQFSLTEPDSKWIVTGGDADYFASCFKNEIFAFPELVLAGLNNLLLYNVEIDR